MSTLSPTDLDRAAVQELSPSQEHEQEQAQGLVEYGLIIALVALLAIGGLMLLGPILGNFFSSMTTSV